VLTPVQMQLLADALREVVRSFTLQLVLTGLRVRELLALRWGNVDLRLDYFRVVETCTTVTSTNPRRSVACAQSQLEYSMARPVVDKLATTSHCGKRVPAIQDPAV
jgi:integrase